MADRVCLVTGVGPGTGSALVKRFAAGGYRVAMLARTEDRLRELAEKVPNAIAYACDVADETQVAATTARVAREVGPVNVLIHNAVGGAWGDFQQIDPAVLQTNFSVNVMALLHLARAVAPAMIDAGEGTILVTGNTSAYRGKAGFAGFAPTKAAQRVLSESMARALGPKGIHVAYLAIDAVIDVPWARQRLPDKPDDFFAKPSAIADVAFSIAHQDRSAWAFDVVVRPYGEPW
ncbi:MAG TPA: SDR family NAD(P)-dependent oxidoreductase [Myxococcota bacterium]|nr:SDR family NAD(P)-dependent oxidoreductase [Myxococcota bacterium]